MPHMPNAQTAHARWKGGFKSCTLYLQRLRLGTTQKMPCFTAKETIFWSFPVPEQCFLTHRSQAENINMLQCFFPATVACVTSSEVASFAAKLQGFSHTNATANFVKLDGHSLPEAKGSGLMKWPASHNETVVWP